jgi:hypothetical protein
VSRGVSVAVSLGPAGIKPTEAKCGSCQSWPRRHKADGGQVR